LWQSERTCHVSSVECGEQLHMVYHGLQKDIVTNI